MGVGTVLEGRFTIDAVVATRPHRQVYLAHDSGGENYEVHALAPTATEAWRARFAAEAQLLSRTGHPCILSAVATGGLPDQTMYSVHPVRTGLRLSDYASVRLRPTQLANLATQLLGAVAHVHDLDWHVGPFDPCHVDLSLQDDRPRARIVRMPGAQSAGGDSSIEADLHRIGDLLADLPVASDPLYPAFVENLDRLRGDPGLPPFTNAKDAAAAFESLYHGARGSAEAWPASTSGGGSIRSLDLEDIPDAGRTSGSVPLADWSSTASGSPSAMEVEPEPKSPLRWIIPAALVAAAVVIVVVTRGGPESDAPTTVSSTPPPATSVAVTAPAPAPERQVASPDPTGALDPIAAVARLNETDLANILPYAERHALIEEVSSRADLWSRVNLRHNQLLDMHQAAHAPRPCATFRAALASVDPRPTSATERHLVEAIRVPTAATVLGAGASPDETCEGLVDAFAAAIAEEPSDTTRARHKPSRSNRRLSRLPPPPAVNSEPMPPPAPAPVAKLTSPPADARPKSRRKRSSIAERLDADLKGL